MFRKCVLCSKDPLKGKLVVRKGLAKNKGGTGRKTSRTTKRSFLPNLQKMRILIDGHPKSVYLCAKCIKKGNFTRAK